MYKIFVVLLISYFWGEDVKSQGKISDSFKINNIHLSLDASIKVAILYQNNFYCLKSDDEVLLFNPATNQIDKIYRDNSKAIGLEDLYLRNDTLIGVSSFETYYLSVATRKWVLFKKAHSGFPGYPIYDDAKYLVSSTCSGEWGGTIYFTDRKTKKVYESECTCAVNVIYHDHKYNVTASLSHMAGFTNIFDVVTPLKLKAHNNYVKPRGYINGKKYSYIGDDESNSKKGTEQLVDSVGTETLLSFECDSKIYYIVGGYKGASLDTIQNKRLIAIEDLTRLNIHCDYQVNRYCSGKQIYTFTNDQKTGFVSVGDNSLTIFSFDYKHQ